MVRAGRMSSAGELQQQLGDYPLAPYLTYHRINSSLGQTTPEQIDKFRSEHADLPVTALLYQRWLKLQGKRRQWQLLNDRRYGTSNAELRCYFVRAQYGVGKKSAALDAAAALWSQPKSQPKACDPIFAVWRNSDQFNQGIIWQRFNASMQSGERVLARYLQRYLTGPHRATAKAYYELRRQPQRITWRGAFAQDTAENRAAISYGITRLSGRDASAAAKAWEKFRETHNFDAAQQQVIDDYVSVGLAEEDQFPTLQQRQSINSDFAVQGLLNAAIERQHWEEVSYWGSRLNTARANDSRTRYWLARASAQSGKPTEFEQLALQRNYYGFLAALQLGSEASLQAMPDQSLSREEESLLLNIPGIARAVELFAVGDDLNGRREWYQQLDQQNQETQHAMAHLAKRLGKLFLSIQTANKAGARDDLAVRFPTAYGAIFDEVAMRRGMDGNLLRAITRQESAFQTKAKSRAGALGLMQVMPATAKLAIRRGGLAKTLGAGSGTVVEQDLLIPERNIEIGSYHLAWLLQRYDNHRPLAIAAYNAGEHRVDRWLKNARNLPIDVWIETIPFKETRNYVQNVLAFEVVYRGLNQRPEQILREHEWITPAG